MRRVHQTPAALGAACVRWRGKGGALAVVLLAVGTADAPRASAAEARASDDAGRGTALGRLRAEAQIGQEFVAFGTPSYTTLGVGGALELMAGAVELAGGIRLALGAIDPNPGASLFVRASLCAAQPGWWQPAVGFELELTSATQPDPQGEVGSLERRYAAANHANHVRSAALASLLRFKGERLFVATGVLRVGTPLSAEVGRRVYWGLGLVDVGWRF